MINTAQTISWIFLATAMASKVHPAKFDGISMIADGINHAIPTHQELQISLNWLVEKGLVLKNQHKYALTEKGKQLVANAENKYSMVMEIWEHIERDISRLF